jgi:hypothetical protein
LNEAYISAFAALAGAIIGGLTSFGTSWFTQRAQLRTAHREGERAKLEALYNDFISEAARLFVDSLTRQTDDVASLVPLYALIGRMRLVSAPAVIVAAERIEANIIEAYLGPNRTFQEVREVARKGGFNFLTEFSKACREDLDARVR